MSSLYTLSSSIFKNNEISRLSSSHWTNANFSSCCVWVLGYHTNFLKPEFDIRCMCKGIAWLVGRSSLWKFLYRFMMLVHSSLMANNFLQLYNATFIELWDEFLNQFMDPTLAFYILRVGSPLVLSSSCVISARVALWLYFSRRESAPGACLEIVQTVGCCSC